MTEFYTFQNCQSDPCLCPIPIDEPKPRSGANLSAQSQYTFGATPSNMTTQGNRVVVATVQADHHSKLVSHENKFHAFDYRGSSNVYGNLSGTDVKLAFSPF
jgi:hypothetical protein